MKRDLRFEQIYPYPPDRVWEAITDPEAMAEWLMPNNFVPQIGHQFQFRTKPAPGFDGIVNCEVIAIEPPHLLAFTWKGGGIDTVVTFTLQAVVGGTKLVLEHKGFTGMKAVMVSFILASGWRKSILPVRLLGALKR